MEQQPNEQLLQLIAALNPAANPAAREQLDFLQALPGNASPSNVLGGDMLQQLASALLAREQLGANGQHLNLPTHSQDSAGVMHGVALSVLALPVRVMCEYYLRETVE